MSGMRSEAPSGKNPVVDSARGHQYGAVALGFVDHNWWSDICFPPREIRRHLCANPGAWSDNTSWGFV